MTGRAQYEILDIPSCAADTRDVGDCRHIIYITANKNRTRQGEWIVGGEPLGGFTIHPMTDLLRDHINYDMRTP